MYLFSTSGQHVYFSCFHFSPRFEVLSQNCIGDAFLSLKFQVYDDKIVQTLFWTSHGPVWTSSDQSGPVSITNGDRVGDDNCSWPIWDTGDGFIHLVIKILYFLTSKYCHQFEVHKITMSLKLRLHQCWWPLKAVSVGDIFKMLLVGLRCWWSICHGEIVTNISVSKINAPIPDPKSNWTRNFRFGINRFWSVVHGRWIPNRNGCERWRMKINKVCKKIISVCFVASVRLLSHHINDRGFNSYPMIIRY